MVRLCFKIILSILFSVTLLGCLGSDSTGESDPESTLPSPSTNLFSVDYYNAGVLVLSEETARVAAAYDRDGFEGVDSEDFSAIWEGIIDVSGDNLTRFFNFGVSQGDVKFYIDGELYQEWSSSSESIEVLFTSGLHLIRVEYTNNWHTTNFNLAISEEPARTTADATAEVQALVTGGTKIAYVGAYESNDFYNEITVNIESSSGPVLLALTSYRGVHWVISNPNNVEIAGIVMGSVVGSVSVEGADSVPVFQISDLGYSYASQEDGTPNLNILTGQLPDLGVGGYSITDATVVVP